MPHHVVNKGEVLVRLSDDKPYKDGSPRYRRISFSTPEYEDVFGREKAWVNWSALGNCSPAEAREYARAILFAADLAENVYRVDSYVHIPRPTEEAT